MLVMAFVPPPALLHTKAKRVIGKNQINIESKINLNNIVIDSKSGYSGAGKKFNIENIKLDNELNFYNYNTNVHRHISEIKQELLKFNSNKSLTFSFNPHILPIFRGMMSTIYCDLNNNNKKKDIVDFLSKNDFDTYRIGIKKLFTLLNIYI